MSYLLIFAYERKKEKFIYKVIFTIGVQIRDV